MNNALVLPVIAFALLAGLLAAAGPATEFEAPRPDDREEMAAMERSLDGLAREIAAAEGRIDPERIKRLIAEAEAGEATP